MITPYLRFTFKYTGAADDKGNIDLTFRRRSDKMPEPPKVRCSLIGSGLCWQCYHLAVLRHGTWRRFAIHMRHQTHAAAMTCRPQCTRHYVMGCRR